MAAGAGDVRLQLGVTLDLVSFRQQLAAASRAAASFSYSINLTANKRELDKQLRSIGRQVRIQINDSQLEGLGRRIETVKANLGALADEKIAIGVTVRNGVTQKDAKSVVADIYRTVRSSALSDTGGKIRIPVSIKPSITKADIADFKKAVKDSLGDLSVNVKANVQGGGKGGVPPNFLNLMEYMRTEGMVGKTASGMEMRMKEPSRAQPQRTLLDQIARAIFFMAGVDPAAIRAREAERKRLPSINWPATTPMATGVSTVSSRALPFGRPFERLPGSSFASQKRLVGDILSPSLKEALRGAANAFVDAVRTELNAAIRSVSVKDLGNTVRAALPPGRIAGLLPAGVGRNPSTYATGFLGRDGESQAEKFARREREARVRSALRSAGLKQHFTERPKLPGTTFMGDEFTAGGGRDRVRGLGQPPSRGGALVLARGPSTDLPRNYFENAKKYSAALEMARATMNKFSASQLPFIGGLRGLAVEFGEATKQVLLYGTAYKGLAFITSLPGQILNAAKGQQQYNNALQTATQDTNTFAKELLFVDNVQRAFGLSLETTRTGFTRLYASMAPTGFDSGSIEKLFTGISAATAALQLTPDKAERVIYAFGQMASKGQIMSEELKGQLGDVLPGALALFAKAAGMSVKDFSKAMEDGVFVGGKFREVFAKVSDELMTRFGTGAQAAGKSLQGLLNTVQGDFQRTLESFSPLANAAAQSILGPLGGALRQLSTSAQIAMGELGRIQSQLSAARQNVEDVRAGGGSASQIQGAEQQVAALEVRYRALNEALKDPAVAKQAKDLQLLVQELTKAGTFVMNLASTIGSMLSPVINFLGTNLTSVIATITTFYVGLQAARLAAMALMGTLMLYRGLSVLLGFAPAALQATALAGAFNVLGVAASGAQVRVVGLRLALTALVASTVIGAVVAGIIAVASAFATMSDKAKEAAQSSQDAAKSAIEAARAGNVAGAAMGVQGVLTESRKAAAARKALEAIYARSSRGQRLGGAMEITTAESIALQGSPLTSGMIQPGVRPGGARQIRVPSKLEMSGIRGQFGSLAGQQAINLREAKEAARQAEIVNKQLGLSKPTPSAFPPEAPGASTRTSKAAQRAAERAALEAQRLQAVERQLSEELRIRRRTLQIDENIAAARADQDDERMAEFESDKRILDIGIRRAKIQKDFDAKRIKAAEYKLRLQLLEIDKTEEQQKYEEDLNRILRERFGITDAIARTAREAREKSFGMGMGAGAFRTDIDLMPGLTNGVLGERQEEIRKELAALLKPANQLVEAANNIGKAFGESFKGMISGSMTAQQALAGFFQSIGDYFLDMASRMIAKWIEMQIIGLAKSLLPGGSTVFPGGAPNFSSAFGPGGPVFQPSAFAANGAVWQGGFTPFADGGIVSGPTLGLVGEGRFNEAIVPLPNGKSIPVDLGDGAGSNISTNIVINVSNGQAQSSMTGGGASDLGRKMEGAVKQVIVNELRPGGVLAGVRR